MEREKITGVILAGGRGQRMGGVDKGLQLLHGRPLIAWVLERLVPQVGAVLINANRNGERYAAFAYPVVADRIADFAGPLAGLHAALAAARTPWVVTVPCDSPHPPADLVARLAAALQDDRSGKAELAVARAGGRLQPVFCLAHCRLLPRLEAYLAGGGRRPGEWLASLGAREVSFDDETAAFSNINTLEELSQQEKYNPRFCSGSAVGCRAGDAESGGAVSRR